MMAASAVVERWRKAGVDRRRRWGRKGAEECSTLEGMGLEAASGAMELAAKALSSPSVSEKAMLTHRAWVAIAENGTSEDLRWHERKVPAPGRPDKPCLVPAREVPTAKKSPLPLNAHLLHSVTHVEFNAINLALDTAIRYAPVQAGDCQQFVRDFIKIADDESRHLGWCVQRLDELGFEYGSIPAHNLLWEGAESTSGDVIDRMVVVPCVQEARGLDAGPRLAERLVGCGDNRTAAIISRIAEEELAHVAVGVMYLRSLCLSANQDVNERFKLSVNRHLSPSIFEGQQFHHEARAAAGLERDWYMASQQEERKDEIATRLRTMIDTEESMSRG